LVPRALASGARLQTLGRVKSPSLELVQGQPSWPIHSSHVRAYLTRLAGHLAPVGFKLRRRTVYPFSVAPWGAEKFGPDIPPLLRVLRGDFLCAPFGGNAKPWRGEQHPPHGESANSTWRLKSVERTGHVVTAHAQLDTRVRRGRIDKFISLVDGQTVVYQRHVFSGMRGPMNIGHHATLKFPDAPGSGIISTSPFVHGQVYPGAFEVPEKRGYQSLLPGARFRSIERVPLQAGGFTALSRYPARRGFEDLVMLSADPKLPLAWTAVVFPKERYAWLSLRNPRQLGHTIFWISNGGRHYPPWNGRHTSVMGLEDVTSYFHDGIAASVPPNPLSRRGIPTALQLSPTKPTAISYIMAVVELPAGFDRVRTVRPTKGGVELLAANGRRARGDVDLGFLEGNAPAAPGVEE
jgi:hypothetical protein